ncbi:MAG: hypothetical protein CL666_15680 [Balneola sp.]|nr:hypothetical protein [Balneola sp.]|tara:strand:- start:101338 stop:102465 length:1128 start_codon:yes stop_codon:yes gene_type:complete
MKGFFNSMTFKILISALLTFLIFGCSSNEEIESNHDFYNYLQRLKALNIESTTVFDDENLSFNTPLRSLVDEDGNLIVVNHTDWTLHYVKENGELIDKKGGLGRGPGEFIGINDLTLGCDNTLFALDKRLQKLSSYSFKENRLEHLGDKLLPNYSPLSMQSFYDCGNKGKFGIFKLFLSSDDNFNSLTVYKLNDSLQLKEKVIELTSDEMIKTGNEVKDNAIGFKNYWHFKEDKLYYTYSDSLDVNILELTDSKRQSISAQKVPTFEFSEQLRSEFKEYFGPNISAMDGLENEIENRQVLPFFYSYTANDKFSFFTISNLGSKPGIILRLNHETQELKTIDSPSIFQLFDVHENKLFGIQNVDGDQSLVRITLSE